MIIKINGEQAFQTLSSNFSISPSENGYTLQISADGKNFSDLFSVGAGVTRMVTGVANGSYYRLLGNEGEVSVNWVRQCNDGGSGSGGEGQGPQGPQGPQGADGPQGPQGPAGSGEGGDSDVLKAVDDLGEAGIGDVKAKKDYQEGEMSYFTDATEISPDGYVNEIRFDSNPIYFDLHFEYKGGNYAFEISQDGIYLRVIDEDTLAADGLVFSTETIQYSDSEKSNFGYIKTADGDYKAEAGFTYQKYDGEDDYSAAGGYIFFYDENFINPSAETADAMNGYFQYPQKTVSDGLWQWKTNAEWGRWIGLDSSLAIGKYDYSSNGNYVSTFFLYDYIPESIVEQEFVDFARIIRPNVSGNEKYLKLSSGDEEGTVKLYYYPSIDADEPTLEINPGETVTVDAPLNRITIFNDAEHKQIRFSEGKWATLDNVINPVLDEGWERVDKNLTPVLSNDGRTSGFPVWDKNGRIVGKERDIYDTKLVKFNTTGNSNTLIFPLQSGNGSIVSWYIPTQGGTAGQVLTSNGNAEPTWATMIKAQQITSADYEALSVKDPNTLYLLVD